MIHTDGRPTIAMRESDSLLPPPINDGRDPGDEHHDPPYHCEGLVERVREWTVEGTDSGSGTPKEDA